MLVKGGNKSSQDGHQLNYQNIISYCQLEMGDIEISHRDFVRPLWLLAPGLI